MYSKSLLIAIAAFAVTASGAQAFMGPGYAIRAGLSPVQTEAFSQARELRLKGRMDEARDVLREAGVDDKTLATLREATLKLRQEMHDAALNNDYEAFREAAKTTPLAKTVASEADFAVFREAVLLREQGEYIEARELLEQLDVLPQHEFSHHFPEARFTPEQADALRAARQVNDRETMQKIFAEAGMEREHRMRHMR